MRSPRALLVGANLAVGLAIAATYGAALGRARWHDEAAYAALALAALAALPLWRRRAFTSLVLASAAAWSVLTGLALLYVTWRLPHGRWMTWWHGATSILFLLAFLAHWARNHPRLVGLSRKLLASAPGALAFVAAWVALAVLAAWTWRARAGFGEADALDWSDASLLAATVGALAGVALARRFRPREPARGRLRGAVDASLLLAMWLATLTGLALQYGGRALRADAAYWPTYAWHVIVSALLLGLALAHVAFNARPLARHARGTAR